MTNNPIDFVVLSDDNHNPRRILKAIQNLRNDMEEQGFKTNIESIYLLGELLSKAEDAAVIALTDRP